MNSFRTNSNAWNYFVDGLFDLESELTRKQSFKITKYIQLKETLEALCSKEIMLDCKFNKTINGIVFTADFKTDNDYTIQCRLTNRNVYLNGEDIITPNVNMLRNGSKCLFSDTLDKILGKEETRECTRCHKHHSISFFTNPFAPKGNLVCSFCKVAKYTSDKAKHRTEREITRREKAEQKIKEELEKGLRFICESCKKPKRIATLSANSKSKTCKFCATNHCMNRYGALANFENRSKKPEKPKDCKEAEQKAQSEQDMIAQFLAKQQIAN